MASKLFIDLVPRSAWFSNLRSELPKEDWDLIRKKAYRAAGYVCQICGGRGPSHPVEAHERWHFSEDTRVQKLVDVVALCPACHEATHYGLARVRGRERYARKQLITVNGWTEKELDKHVFAAMDDYERRGKLQWTLDATWLLSYVHLSEESRAVIQRHAQQLQPRRLVEPLQTSVKVRSGREDITFGEVANFLFPSYR